jgi:hypothetical protein
MLHEYPLTTPVLEITEARIREHLLTRFVGHVPEALAVLAAAKELGVRPPHNMRWGELERIVRAVRREKMIGGTQPNGFASFGNGCRSQNTRLEYTQYTVTH